MVYSVAAGNSSWLPSVNAKWINHIYLSGRERNEMISAKWNHKERNTSLLLDTDPKIPPVKVAFRHFIAT